MSLIRKPQELVLQPKLKVLIYGQAGVGKSTLALSAPKPLMIDCDDIKGRFIIDREVMDRLLPIIEGLIIEYRNKIKEL